MSKNQFIRTLRNEIKSLNWTIDMKIVRGVSYRQEARRHKFLLMQLNHLTQREPANFFGKLSHVMATLMF